MDLIASICHVATISDISGDEYRKSWKENTLKLRNIRIHYESKIH